MPLTSWLIFTIGNRQVDIGSIKDFGFKMSYVLEEPQNFMSKQGADPLQFNLPASTTNDVVFNTFWNPYQEDTAPAALSFKELMPCLISVNGTVPIMSGYAVIEDAVMTDKPESYGISVYGANGLWVLDLQNVTLWDCVNPNPHVFTVDIVEHSWSDYGLRWGLPNEVDYVYAPVRYRQPFDGTTLGFAGDNCVNIYHLRPSISLVRIIQRGFAKIGFTINSEFLNTAYCKGLVLPWTWGDFYDINSQFVTGIGFQAAGRLPTASEPPPSAGSTIPFWSGNTSGASVGTVGGSSFWLSGFSGGFNNSTYSGGVMSIDNGIEYNTTIGAMTIAIAGAGYAPGDTFTVSNVFGDHATGIVNTVGVGGAVTSISITFPGTASGGGGTYSEGYAAGKQCFTVATSGGGAGLEVLIVSNAVAHPVGTGINANFNYITTGQGSTPGGFDNFRMDIDFVPDGYDDFLLYEFDDASGTMIYTFNPPASLAGVMSNVSINFALNLYCLVTTGTSAHALIGIECEHQLIAGRVVLSCQSIMPDGREVGPGTHYPSGSGYPTTPTVVQFTIPNCNPGDVLRFRLCALADSTALTAAHTLAIFSGAYLNNNPAVIGVPSYAYNPVTQQFGYITPNTIWSPLHSVFTMTGFLIKLGNNVNMQNYDAFRNYMFLDMFAGVVDTFNLEIQTDNINKVVTIEPMFGGTLPTNETYKGYFKKDAILDYTDKQDLSVGKGNRISLFSSANRQIDLTFKLDGNDEGANIWAKRFKGIYLNNRPYTGGVFQNNINIDNGIIAGIPGAARYMLPNRFAKGNMQLANRFFSPVMHCLFTQWKGLNNPGDPAPQLICIFSGDSTSDSAYKDVFGPKLAWYAGNHRGPVVAGGWLWIGNPAAPNPVTTQNLPLMFAVNYGSTGVTDPVLSYCDENISGAQLPGLLSQFYRQRFALMRNGQMMHSSLRLNLNDICNWTHRECIKIDKGLYALIEIDGFNPMADESTPCTFWKVVPVEQVDVDMSFPSSASILSATPLTMLGQFDIRYAPLLLFPSDLPQVS